MALTTYRSKQAVTLQTRDEAYDLLARLLRHLHPLNLNLLRVELVAGNFVEIDLNNPLPANQLDHLHVELKP